MGFVSDFVSSTLGAVGNVVGSVFGGGSSSQSNSSPAAVKTDPTPVSMTDTSADTGKDTLATKRRKRQGIGSTQTGAGSLATQANDNKRTTLG